MIVSHHFHCYSLLFFTSIIVEPRNSVVSAYNTESTGHSALALIVIIVNSINGFIFNIRNHGHQYNLTKSI